VVTNIRNITTKVRIIWMHKRCLSIDCLTLYSASGSILIAFEADKPCVKVVVTNIRNIARYKIHIN
jgi:hypothetical protein